MRRILSLLLVGGSFSAHAQATLDVGSRVRVTSFETAEYPFGIGRMTGPITGIRGDTVFVAGPTGHDMWFPRQRITRLELSTQQKHPIVRASLTGAAMGAAFGLLYGAARTAAPSALCIERQCPVVPTTSRRRGAAQGGVAGAGIGISVGFLVGSFLKTDRWVDVPLASIVALPRR